MNTFTCTSMLHVSNTQGINMVSMEDNIEKFECKIYTFSTCI